MHIAVVSLGAFGHVNPTLSFVTELVKRGVKVTYFTTEDFRRIIEPTGAKFVPVPSWMASNAPQNENKEGGDDDGGDNRNFKITQTLKANTTYIFACKFYSTSVTGNISLMLKKSA